MPTRVSVIVPFFNNVAYLRQAVESLLATRYPNLEIVLFDDGSTDGSSELGERLAREYEDVRLFSHPGRVNCGAGITRNAGVMKSSGDYLAFLDADDYVLPLRFSRSVEILDSSPCIDAVCGVTERLVESGGEERARFIRPKTVFDCDDPDRVLEHRLFHGLAWSTNAILLRREAFERVGGFSDCRIAEDAVLWLKLACTARIVSAGHEVIAIYRIYARGPDACSGLAACKSFNSSVLSETLTWATHYGVEAGHLSLLARGLASKALIDNRVLREDRRFTAALVHLGQLVLRHPVLLSRSAIWRVIGCTLMEWLRMRRPAFNSPEGKE